MFVCVSVSVRMGSSMGNIYYDIFCGTFSCIQGWYTFYSCSVNIEPNLNDFRVYLVSLLLIDRIYPTNHISFWKRYRKSVTFWFHFSFSMPWRYVSLLWILGPHFLGVEFFLGGGGKYIFEPHCLGEIFVGPFRWRKFIGPNVLWEGAKILKLQ